MFEPGNTTKEATGINPVGEELNQAESLTAVDDEVQSETAPNKPVPENYTKIENVEAVPGYFRETGELIGKAYQLRKELKVSGQETGPYDEILSKFENNGEIQSFLEGVFNYLKALLNPTNQEASGGAEGFKKIANIEDVPSFLRKTGEMLGQAYQKRAELAASGQETGKYDEILSRFENNGDIQLFLEGVSSYLQALLAQKKDSAEVVAKPVEPVAQPVASTEPGNLTVATEQSPKPTEPAETLQRAA